MARTPGEPEVLFGESPPSLAGAPPCHCWPNRAPPCQALPRLATLRGRTPAGKHILPPRPSGPTGPGRGTNWCRAPETGGGRILASGGDEHKARWKALLPYSPIGLVVGNFLFVPRHPSCCRWISRAGASPVTTDGGRSALEAEEGAMTAAPLLLDPSSMARYRAEEAGGGGVVHPSAVMPAYQPSAASEPRLHRKPDGSLRIRYR